MQQVFGGGSSTPSGRTVYLPKMEQLALANMKISDPHWVSRVDLELIPAQMMIKQLQLVQLSTKNL